MVKGFKDFITGGNLIETAVALVMALAVVALVNALIADIITPIIGAIVGEPDFSGLTFSINDSEFFYGDFINALITFVSIGAAVYFFIVVPYNRYKEIEESPPARRPAPNASRRFLRTPRAARIAASRREPRRRRFRPAPLSIRRLPVRL